MPIAPFHSPGIKLFIASCLLLRVSLPGGLSGSSSLGLSYLFSPISHYSPCSSRPATWVPFCLQKHMLLLWNCCTYGSLLLGPCFPLPLQESGYPLDIPSRSLVIPYSCVRSQHHLGLVPWHCVPFCHSPYLNLQSHVRYQRDGRWYKSESTLPAIVPHHLPCPSKCVPQNRRLQRRLWEARSWGEIEGPSREITFWQSSGGWGLLGREWGWDSMCQGTEAQKILCLRKSKSPVWLPPGHWGKEWVLGEAGSKAGLQLEGQAGPTLQKALWTMESPWEFPIGKWFE